MNEIKKATGESGNDSKEILAKGKEKINFTFNVFSFSSSHFRIAAQVENKNFATLIMPKDDWENLTIRKQVAERIAQLFFQRYRRGGHENGSK